MRRILFRSSAAVAASFALLASGCRDSTAPAIDPRIAAGSYVLESVAGRGPASGSFVLTSDGQATRRVRYAVSQGLSPEYVAVGTFALLPNDSIRFSLRENAGTSDYVWTVRGTRSAQRFSIHYPDPADGDVVETYGRSSGS